jgi:hypothetical protein
MTGYVLFAISLQRNDAIISVNHFNHFNQWFRQLFFSVIAGLSRYPLIQATLSALLGDAETSSA